VNKVLDILHPKGNSYKLYGPWGIAGKGTLPGRGVDIWGGGGVGGLKFLCYNKELPYQQRDSQTFRTKGALEEILQTEGGLRYL